MAEFENKQQLFTVTQENLETGMRGYPVGFCTTSSVDPEKGLFYVGMPLSDMADWQPMEIIYLLYSGHKGSPNEVALFERDIIGRSNCGATLIEKITALPREGHPMKLFVAALLLCAMVEGCGDYSEDALNVIAKIPLIAAAVINHHAGWGGIRSSKPQLGYMENFTHMLNVPEEKKGLSDIFKLFNILHYDHGGGNLSCFIGKGIASGLEDLYGSLAGAMCALAGPRHGKANQDALDFVKGVVDELGDDPKPSEVEAYVRRCLDEGGLIYGFGHAVLRVEDPRATLLYNIAQERYADHPLVKAALLLRSEAPKVLKENAKISNPYPNVDAISGTLLSAAGFPYPEYYTVLFGLSRCVGVARQIVYERMEARDGKGTPIIRPKYYFKKQGVTVYGGKDGL